MTREDLESLEYLAEKARRIHLDKFKFNGKFITIGVANKMIEKAKRCK